MQFLYSRALCNNLNDLGILANAVRSSERWRLEQSLNPVEDRTGCVTALAPFNQSDDMQISISVGLKEGMDIVDHLKLVCVGI